MGIWRFFDSVAIFRAILVCAAFIVPRSERPEWISEWSGELWYILHNPGGANLSSARVQQSPISFCLGSFQDAIWLRLNRTDSVRDKRLWLRSPVRCIVFLLILAAITSWIAYRESMLQPPYTDLQIMASSLLVLFIAVLILPSTTTFSLGQYPVGVHSTARSALLNQFVFLGIKVAILLPTVFCGTLALAPGIALAGLRPQGMLIGYFFALRWALIDQRRRCPVCLRLLTNPVRVGQPSHTMLDWYGTELMCSKGHGLLHVPETSTSSYGSQKWLPLDSSWRSLFL
jgi:hypothetical protein